jgi:hypothetical protein
MDMKKAIEQWEPGYLQLLVLFVLLQMFVSLFTTDFTLTFEESLWQFIGRNWFRHGLVPYSGGVDNQSPLIFAIFGLSDRLFGVNYWFPRVLGTMCQSAGLYYIYKIASHIAGKQAGILALSLYGLSLLWHVTGNQSVSYTETYEVTFLIISVYCFIKAQNKTDFLITGIIAGIGLGFRISAVFAVTAFFLFALYKNKLNALIFCAGVLLSIVCLVLVGYLAGINIRDQYIYAFADNFNQGSPYDRTAQWKLNQFAQKFIYSPMILFYPLIIGYCIIKKRVDLFVLWLVFAFAGVAFIGEYTWVHLREVIPSLSIMGSITIMHIITVYKLPFKLVLLTTWVIFFPNLLNPLMTLKNLIFKKDDGIEDTCTQPYTRPEPGKLKKLGWWVGDHTSITEKIFVAGFGAQVQVYSERQSVYFNEMQTPLAKKMLFYDLEHNKPAMILVPLFPQYEQYIQADERLFVNNIVAKYYYLDRCMYSYNIYKIKE